MRSIGRRLERSGGATPGRAPLLVGAVALLALLQGAEVAGGFLLLFLPGVWALYPFVATALGSLVGFAAAGRRERGSWRAAASDGVRLVGPGYVLAILLAAFAIGPAVASDGARFYLTDPGAYAYLLNLAGWPRFFLPGVFEFNDLPGVVNRNVWMAPAALAILAVACWRPAGRFARAAPVAPVALAAGLALGALAVEGLDVALGPAPNIAELALRGDALSALLGGFLGVAAFRGRGRLPDGRRVAAGAAVLLLLLALAGDASWAASAWFRVLCAVPVVHLAIWRSARRSRASAPARRLEAYLPSFLFLSFPFQQLAAGLVSGFLVVLAVASAAAAGLSVLLVRLVVRRLLGPELLAVDDGDAAGPTRRPSVAISIRSALVHLAVGAVLVALCIMFMLMLYIAFTPDPGGL